MRRIRLGRSAAYALVAAGLSLGLGTACDNDGRESQLGSCIDAVRTGDHTYACGGLEFLTRISSQCAAGGCGLIIDVHGGAMTAPQMRQNTLLHELAAPRGYITIHPDAVDASFSSADYPIVRAFLAEALEEFRVDRGRVHFTGFSQGGIMTWFFICNHRDLLTTAAPIASLGNTQCRADQVDPTLPILYMNGTGDLASRIGPATASVQEVLAAGGYGPGTAIAGDDTFTRTRFTNPRGGVFDLLVHEYGGQAVLDGHCIPGGRDQQGLRGTSCDNPVSFVWGEVVLDFFERHE